MLDSQPRFDAPGPGRVLTSVAEVRGVEIRAAATSLKGAPSSREIYDQRFAARDMALGPSIPSRMGPSWAVIGMAVSFAAVHGRWAALGEAERWFFRGKSELVPTFSHTEIGQAEAHLFRVPIVGLRDLLPYIIDAQSPGTRRAVLKDANQAASRVERRRNGVYYTPGDVADFMVSLVISDPAATVLDPACGSGVFLRSAMRRLIKLGNPDAMQSLYGMDIDPLAVDSACFVLTVEDQIARDVEPWRSWHIARSHLAVRDSLKALLEVGGHRPALASASARADIAYDLGSADTLTPSRLIGSSERSSLGETFPEIDQGFVVVGNPPYSSLGARDDFHRISTLSVVAGVSLSAATSSYLPFLEYMWAASRDRLSSSLVVPLSLAYSSTKVTRAARKAIQQAGGVWEFRFFDRTPDSLFGDDVKQRAAIIVRRPGSRFHVATTSLLRWTSRQRPALFEFLPGPVPLGIADLKSGLPKIGAKWESELFELVSAQPGRLGDALDSSCDPSDSLIHVGSTAYNRIVLYRQGDSITKRVDGMTLGSSNPEIANWAYAVLSSSLVYWLWRVQGDGFHVPLNWVLSLPFAWRSTESQRSLARAGHGLWSEALRSPVSAMNSGKATISYPAPAEEVTTIDTALMKQLGAPTKWAAVLREFREGLVQVGREKRAKRDN